MVVRLLRLLAGFFCCLGDTAAGWQKLELALNLWMASCCSMSYIVTKYFLHCEHSSLGAVLFSGVLFSNVIASLSPLG